jgi:hypothetical protein
VGRTALDEPTAPKPDVSLEKGDASTATPALDRETRPDDVSPSSTPRTKY